VLQSLPGASLVVTGALPMPIRRALATTFENEFSSNVTSYSGKRAARYR
jgi:hypothetical protein